MSMTDEVEREAWVTMHSECFCYVLMFIFSCLVTKK